MMKFTKEFVKGITEITFPNVCVCCGHETTTAQREICSFCITERFEEPPLLNDQQSSRVIMPEGIKAQIALWKFDKGGRLQDLMHLLKYEGIANIGIQLGQRVGDKYYHIINRYVADGNSEGILVPVPLHYVKFRYRGFNQAYLIAQGVQMVTDMPICSVSDVVRIKNTRTQTGLNVQKRVENIEGAFKVRNRKAFQHKIAVIVDDVFTTGATTFELSRELQRNGVNACLIITLAQA